MDQPSFDFSSGSADMCHLESTYGLHYLDSMKNDLENSLGRDKILSSFLYTPIKKYAANELQ